MNLKFTFRRLAVRIRRYFRARVYSAYKPIILSSYEFYKLEELRKKILEELNGAVEELKNFDDLIARNRP